MRASLPVTSANGVRPSLGTPSFLPTRLATPTAPSTSRRSVVVACRSSGRDQSRDQRRHPEADDDSATSSSVPDALPLAGVDSDWRSFRAQLVARSRAAAVVAEEPQEEEASTSGRTSTSELWAHSLPQPEKGCVLLAHPMMFTSSQEYFFQAVILILDHNETGSFGIILNRPSMYTLSELNLTHPLPEFDNSTLYVGGDVGGGDITLLHARPELEGSVEVVKGVCVGGILAAQAAVQSGRAEVSDFRFFAKYAGWGPGQLESECRRGVWFTAAASPQAILQAPTARDGSDRWHQMLELMGGDYAKLSVNVKASQERQRLRRGAAAAASPRQWDGDSEPDQPRERELGQGEADEQAGSRAPSQQQQ